MLVLLVGLTPDPASGIGRLKQDYANDRIPYGTVCCAMIYSTSNELISLVYYHYDYDLKSRKEAVEIVQGRRGKEVQSTLEGTQSLGATDSFLRSQNRPNSA